jgi:phosphatidylglycerophosphate synthase
MVQSIKDLEKRCQNVHLGGFYDRALRKISIRMTWAFLHTKMTANQISFLSGVVGVLGATLFIYSSPLYWILGWGILQIHLILDRVDGEVARYRKSESGFGDYMETFVHYLVQPFIFVPISFGLYNIFKNQLIFALGFSAIFGMVLLSIHDIYLLKAYKKRKGVALKEGTEAGIFGTILDIFKKIRDNIWPSFSFHTMMLASILDLFFRFPEIGVPMNFRFLALAAFGIVLPLTFFMRAFAFSKELRTKK